MPTTPGHISSEQARALAAQRKTRAGGRPKLLRPCPKCCVQLSARDLWRHRC